jgi:hypothetical protein
MAMRPWLASAWPAVGDTKKILDCDYDHDRSEFHPTPRRQMGKCLIAPGAPVAHGDIMKSLETLQHLVDELMRKGRGKGDPERIADALHNAVAGLKKRLPS